MRRRAETLLPWCFPSGEAGAALSDRMSLPLGLHFERRTTTSSKAALLLFDVPEHRDRRGHIAAHGLAPRHRLHELAEGNGDALADDARLDLLGDLELLLGVAFADESGTQFLDLLVERPTELGAIAARLGIVIVYRIEQHHHRPPGHGDLPPPP